MQDYFQTILTRDKINEISSIGLAHLGDAVYELLVRTYLCAHGKATGKKLHWETIARVCAEEQAQGAQVILPEMTSEEVAVFKRGRNAQVRSVPTHASRAQYSTATALEALFGWLYLRGERSRINTLFCLIMDEYETRKEE